MGHLNGRSADQHPVRTPLAGALRTGIRVCLGGLVLAIWGATSLPTTPAVAEEPPASGMSTLPGGASSLQESYQNWLLSCAQDGATKHCSISQQQMDAKTNQRILAVEIGGTLEQAQGVIVLPFGLSLAAGVTLQVDDGASKIPMAFRTCLPVGCIVPVTLEATDLEEWRKGTALKLTTVSDGGQETVFTVSLDGFSAAYNRLDSLGK